MNGLWGCAYEDYREYRTGHKLGQKAGHMLLRSRQIHVKFAFEGGTLQTNQSLKVEISLVPV